VTIEMLNVFKCAQTDSAGLEAVFDLIYGERNSAESESAPKRKVSACVVGICSHAECYSRREAQSGSSSGIQLKDIDWSERSASQRLPHHSRQRAASK
jgi:hypothetical protein